MNAYTNPLYSMEPTYTESYIQYTQELEQTITQLELLLHDIEDPEEIIMNVLTAATSFYDADSACIIEADLTTKLWTKTYGYVRENTEDTNIFFDDIQDGDYLHCWIKSLTQGKPLIIEDVSTFKDSATREFDFLTYNRIRSLIAVPFWKHPTGFIVVRNPKRYMSRSCLLKMMVFIVVSSINEKRVMESTKLALSPEIIQKDNDVVINLFDTFQIITQKGILTDQDLNSAKKSRLIVYLLLHTRRPASPYEITQDLWPNEDLSRASKNVKALVYRVQQQFSLISDYRLIECTATGYRINPELNIITDMKQFEDFWHLAQKSTNPTDKVCLLKRAIEIYKQGLVEEFSGEHWFMPTVAHYSLRYTGVLTQLLSTLNDAQNYISIHEYANAALSAIPGSPDAYYWLIYAMTNLGLREIARNELRAAKQVLTENDYDDLIIRLKENIAY